MAASLRSTRSVAKAVLPNRTDREISAPGWILTLQTRAGTPFHCSNPLWLTDYRSEIFQTSTWVVSETTVGAAIGEALGLPTGLIAYTQHANNPDDWVMRVP